MTALKRWLWRHCDVATYNLLAYLWWRVRSLVGA